MGMEQRKHRRADQQVLIDLDPPHGRNLMEGTCLDLSLSGMRVRVDQAYEPDFVCTVSCSLIRGLSSEFFLEAPATVRWCRKESQDTDEYLIGLEFSGLDDATLAELEKYVTGTSLHW